MYKQMLETNSLGVKKSADSAPVTDVVGGGFKGFNRTGREDTTEEILRPTVDSGTRAKYAALIAVVVILLGVVGFMAFSRSRLTFEAPSDTPRPFAPSAPQGE